MSDPTPPASAETAAPRSRAMDEVPALAAQAVEYLRMPRAAVPMTADDARAVVALMRLVSYPKGGALFREGDEHNAHHMLLLLEGDVAVDAGPADSVAISVLGPGSVLGEMSLSDGAPRSASCTAMSPVLAAGLSRAGLERLINDKPQAAARLLVALLHCTAERLRALSQQLQMQAEVIASQRRGA
jgi:CRP-like cAMP-binding protein